jgi:serine/threonine protein kinase
MAPGLTGQTLGQYRILEELGRGGMAVVYKAYQPALDRCVAIKVLPRELTFDREFVERFLREAKAAARLNHPNIVTIHDVGRAEGAHFIVMEYVDGPSLAELLQRREGLPSQRASRVVSDVARALDYAHQRGFVHRDVKPGNILLSADGTAKLVDFGIVKAAEGTRLTQTGTLLGTPAYMSPEQAKGAAIGQGTDIYSLGVVTYEMLSGRVPFTGPTVAVLHAHVYDPPDLGVLPGGVQHVVGKALAKDPGARYGSAGAFARALDQVMAGRPAGIPEPRPPSPPPSPQRRERSVPVWVWGLGAAAVGLALITGIAVAAVFGFLASPSPTPTPESPTPRPTFTATALPTGSPTPSVDEPVVDEVDPSPTPFDTPTPLSTPTRDLTMRWTSIGRSVQGRELSVGAIGEPADLAVFLVGSIQGDQPNTRQLVAELSTHFRENSDQIPEGVALYFLPSLNPDGNASNSRYNANDVDLNRNWGTDDWTSSPEVPGHEQGKPGAGGTGPFSEPETAAAADFISSLRSQTREVFVVIFHSSVRRSKGEVYPGGDNSLAVAGRYASTADYDVEDEWAEYTTSGEMVTWCAEQGMPSIDVVIPASQQPSSQVPGTNRTLQDLAADALLDAADALGR